MQRTHTPPIYYLQICGFAQLLCCAVMSFTGEFAIRAMLSQFDKRGSSGNQEHNSNDMSPGAILAIVIAALTLLVAVIPLFRCPRFHHWMFSSISPFFKVYQPLVLPEPNHIYVLNLIILYRKLSELPFQALCRRLLLPQKTQVSPQLLRYLHFTLSSFTTTIPTPAPLVHVPMLSDATKMELAGEKEVYCR